MQGNNAFYRQPWFLPISVLICIILWLQLLPGNVDPSGGLHTDGRKPMSTEDIHAYITAEVREHIIEASKAKTYDRGSFPPVASIPEGERMRILVTGGSGFVGSHLVDRLMSAGHQVIVVDNMFTGRKKNIAQWLGHPNFQLIVHDVVEPIMLEVDQIYHLACPASPPHYQYNPIKTIKTSTEGTLNMLGLAKRVQARMLLTSTSEVYGDPEVRARC